MLPVIAAFSQTPTSPTTEFHYMKSGKAHGANRCVYVDLGAHSGDSFDYFRTATTFKSKNPLKAQCLNPSKCYDFGMLWTLPTMGCPIVPNRTNVEYYGVEANPQHDGALLQRYRAHEAFRGLFLHTAIWNHTSLTEGIEFLPFSLFEGGGLGMRQPNSHLRMTSDKSAWAGGSMSDMSFGVLTSEMKKTARRNGWKPIFVPTLDVCELLLDTLKLKPVNKVALKVDVEDVAEITVLSRLLARPDCVAVIDSIAYEQGDWHKPNANAGFNKAFEAAGVTVRPWA